MSNESAEQAALLTSEQKTTRTTNPDGSLLVVTTTTRSVSPKAGSPNPEGAPLSPSAQPTLSNEYRFVHQRIPPREGKLRFLLPATLLTLQVIFIIVFGLCGNYAISPEEDKQTTKQYPLFADLHAIALLGFGFLMTFLKRYGYGSVGFNLLLVGLIIQFAIILRGFFEYNDNLQFSVGINNLVKADFTVIAVLIAFGAVLGKVTLIQLVIIAILGSLLQVVNEFVNVEYMQAYDVGRSVYVHLFGALFGLAVSKCLHCASVKSSKQASVYHSDIFALIGTLFLWVFYPSFNGLLAQQAVTGGQTRAIVNTIAAIAASCVVTFGVSSLAGKGKINVLHVQHATIAGGIAIGSVADLNVQIYVALIVGSVAGLISTVGYQFIDPIINRVMKLHDTCGVHSLHVLPGVIAALVGIIFAACSGYKEYGMGLYQYYPARLPAFNTTEHADQNIESVDGLGRSAEGQALFQFVAFAITIGIALLGGAITGFLLRLPLFEQLSEDVEMFDDEAQWVTPDDYALKLTFANSQPAATAEEKV